MARARTFLPTALLAIACVVLVSLGAALHHHAGPSTDCAVCQAASAPAAAAPVPSGVAAPAALAVVRFLEPRTASDRLVAANAPARAPPTRPSDEA
jgi:hypothetical protein